MTLQALLAGAADFCHRRARLVVLLFALLAGLAGLLAWQRLGIDTDSDDLFAASLPWRQRELAFARDFPQFTDLLVVVIDAAVPEAAEATAASLADRLAADRAHFRAVSRPDALPFFAREGLLFLDPADLGDLLDRAIDAQPFLGQLAADPSARGLFAALSLIGMGVTQGQAELGPYLPALDAFHRTLAAAADGRPRPLSWQLLLGGKLAEQAGKYRFVLATPVLDYAALEPGGAATAALRAAAGSLEFVADGTARVRVTGSVALSDEEFATVAQGAAAATIGSAALIALWLFLAVGSWRVIVPILLTLALGLVLTTGFAAAAVGTLNLVSLAFAVLFVGIAVDFAIQFAARFRAAQRETIGIGAALAATASRAGGQILLAALATAAGFYAFVPTDFRGVAELGLIAGTGMLIAFLCTILFLPAALSLFHPRPARGEVGLAAGAAAERVLRRHRQEVLAAFGLLAFAGAALLPRLVFDSDPLHTKDPHTEAMRTLADLMDDPLTNPYGIDILTASLPAATALAGRLDALPGVDHTITLGSFVPAGQPQKLALIADAAGVLAATLAPRPPAAPVTAAEIRLAIGSARGQLATALPKLAPGHPLAAIDADLARLTAAPDATLLAMNRALTRFLPLAITRLREALAAEPVTLDQLPAALRRDWIAPDGRARVQVLPKRAASTGPALGGFVRAVQALAPEAGGSAAVIVASSATILGAFRTAAIAAIVAIAVILLAALRRVRDAALVLAALLLAGLLTVLVVALAGLALDFANIIALPLLFGVGVSFNVYFVMNWRDGATQFLGSATARAVLFSAATTATAFGSLALSRHPGTAGMGDLLLISLGCTLVTSLVFVPALLSLLRRGASTGP